MGYFVWLWCVVTVLVLEMDILGGGGGERCMDILGGAAEFQIGG